MQTKEALEQLSASWLKRIGEIKEGIRRIESDYSLPMSISISSIAFKDGSIEALSQARVELDKIIATMEGDHDE